MFFLCVGGYAPVGDGVPTSHQRGGAALLGPLWEGLSAQPTGEEKNAGHLSPRQRFALTPPSQREARGDGFPRQCVPQGHLLRGAHWLGMTARRAGNGGTHGSRPTGCGGHPGRTESSAPTKQNKNRAKRGAAVIQDGRRRPPLQGRTGTAQNGTAGTAYPTNRRRAAGTAKFRNFFFPLSASAGLRRLYSDDTGRPPVL